MMKVQNYEPAITSISAVLVVIGVAVEAIVVVVVVVAWPCSAINRCEEFWISPDTTEFHHDPAVRSSQDEKGKPRKPKKIHGQKRQRTGGTQDCSRC